MKHRQLRVFVPLNLRGCDQPDTGLGNRISIMPVNLPMDIRDPMKLMAAVHERTSAVKGARLAEFIYMAGTCLGMLPPSLQALSGPLSPLITFPIFNLVCTNIPGPQQPLYMLGRKALTYYPHVPIGNDWGIGCAVQSYDGSLFFGLTADSVAVPDVRNIADMLDLSFAHARKSAGIPAEKPTRPQAAATRAPKPRPRAAAKPPQVEPPPATAPAGLRKTPPPQQLDNPAPKTATSRPARRSRRAHAETPETRQPLPAAVNPSETLPPPEEVAEPLDQAVATIPAPAPVRIVS